MIARGLTVLGLLVALTPTAWAEKHAGAAAGVGLALGPYGGLGFSGSLFSLVTDFGDEQVPAALLQLRGEVLGVVTSEASAALPLLSADAGLGVGPLDLFVTAGVEVFGFAWRGGYTLFTSFGLVGGGGLALKVHPRVDLQLRGIVTWLPDFAAPVLNAPDPAPDRPTLLFVSATLGVGVSY